MAIGSIICLLSVIDICSEPHFVVPITFHDQLGVIFDMAVLRPAVMAIASYPSIRAFIYEGCVRFITTYRGLGS